MPRFTPIHRRGIPSRVGEQIMTAHDQIRASLREVTKCYDFDRNQVQIEQEPWMYLQGTKIGGTPIRLDAVYRRVVVHGQAMDFESENDESGFVLIMTGVKICCIFTAIWWCTHGPMLSTKGPRHAPAATWFAGTGGFSPGVFIARIFRSSWWFETQPKRKKRYLQPVKRVFLAVHSVSHRWLWLQGKNQIHLCEYEAS